MSQLIITRFFKPSLCKTLLKPTNIRLLSSTTHTCNDDNKLSTNWSSKDYSSMISPAYPFLFIDHLLKDSPNGQIKDKTLVNEICHAMTSGFLRDGLEFSIMNNDDNDNDDDDDDEDESVRVIIDYTSSNPNLKPMDVYLPPLPTGSQIQNLAMSSLPTQNKDWVVGVKLSGSRVSFCRPYGSSQWVHIKTKPASIHPFASLMFSKKDSRFYVPTPGGNYLCYFDPKNGEDQHDFIDLEFDYLPNSVFDDLVDVSSCSKTDHLVESPTGQLFLVRWFGEDMEDDDHNEYSLMHTAKHFMVFRAEETGNKNVKGMIYTEDIGDLCIFLGHSEAFCVPASSSPGLKPNCIYFVGYNFGVYDLTTKTCTVFYTGKYFDPLRKSGFPYWPPPVHL